jgi:hypothetical protein
MRGAWGKLQLVSPSGRTLLFVAITGATSASCAGGRGAGTGGSTALVAPLIVTGRPTRRTDEAAIVSRTLCAPETDWDGLACVHVRATCGGWDGLSCDHSKAPTPQEEHAAISEFVRSGDEALAVCPEGDEASQVYSGDVREIFEEVDTALRHAEQLGQRLAQLTQGTPQWEVAALARVGSLYDCIWNSLRRTSPPQLNSQQQTLLARLGRLTMQLRGRGQGPEAQQIQAQIADVRRLAEGRWLEERDRYLALIEPKMVSTYVSATLLARRYALEGFTLTRACARLPVIASILGDERMALLLEDTADPTDPEPDAKKRRRVSYGAGVFCILP